MSGLSGLHIPTPFASHGLLLLKSGFRADPNKPVCAVRPVASGDISLKPGQTSNEFIAWWQPTLGSYNPSSLVYGDIYYTLYDTSFFAANDPVTGKEIYPKQRISARISTTPCGSRPLIGSSRIMTSGSLINAAATARRCFMPIE